MLLLVVDRYVLGESNYLMPPGKICVCWLTQINLAFSSLTLVVVLCAKWILRFYPNVSEDCDSILTQEKLAFFSDTKDLFSALWDFGPFLSRLWY